MLVPELDVTALATSLRFYAEVLEFRILFERPAERFAYLERDGVELMIQEAAGPGRRFRTAPLELPLVAASTSSSASRTSMRCTPEPLRPASTSLCRSRSAGTGLTSPSPAAAGR